jgi:large subunit ribosomal protein L9
MKVLLKEDVEKLGYAGEVHQVAAGYGRNYLIPKGLAVLATPGMMKQAESWRKQAEARREQVNAEYRALSARINDVTLTFTARAGETGKLYGSVTMAQVVERLNETLGIEIDRRKVEHEPLRQLGEHKVPVRLSADFQPELTVIIQSDQVEAAVPANTETETAEPTDSEMETAELTETVV